MLKKDRGRSASTLSLAGSADIFYLLSLINYFTQKSQKSQKSFDKLRNNKRSDPLRGLAFFCVGFFKVGRIV